LKSKSVIIIGGGIAGLTAAWELARQDVDVHLVEKDFFLGGHAIEYNCKATDTCQQCDACTVEKVLKNVSGDSRITLHLASEVQDISTRNGDFTVTLKENIQFAAPQEQEKLAAAYAGCPVPGAIRRGPSINNKPLYAVDESLLAQLRDQAPDLFGPDGLNPDKQPAQETLTAGAVLLATGFEPFNPESKPTYNSASLKNVVSAFDLEMIKKDRGHYTRPSDGQPARKVAFIQCVGSRNEQLGHLWCSHVCCPYALRMAEVMKKEHPETEVTVFYMDVQNCGREHLNFYQQCQSDFRFVRNIPVDIYPGENDSPLVSIMDENDGTLTHEAYDLVVLSVGIMPGPDNARLAELARISLTPNGFMQSVNDLDATSTAVDGIFVAGTATGPKSIAETMANAGQAVRNTVKHLGVSR
jgi:heterodisulfide reductase subunit A